MVPPGTQLHSNLSDGSIYHLPFPLHYSYNFNPVSLGHLQHPPVSESSLLIVSIDYKLIYGDNRSVIIRVNNGLIKEMNIKYLPDKVVERPDKFIQHLILN